jgi:hypothetical protein
MFETLTKFQERIAYLDAFLTHKEWKAVEHTARTQRATPERFLSEVYYLSDGGYSRIALNEQTGHIFITSNSLGKPKQNWSFAKEMVADIERDIHVAIPGYWDECS